MKSGKLRAIHDITTVSTVLSIVDIETGDTIEKRTVTERPVALNKVEELAEYIIAVTSARMTLQQNLDSQSSVKLAIAKTLEEDENAA